MRLPIIGKAAAHLPTRAARKSLDSFVDTAASLGPEPPNADRLVGRGLDALLEEYARPSTNEGRRQRLLAFFELCEPETRPRDHRDLTVRVLFRDDLGHYGRLTTLAEGSQQVADVIGNVLPDQPVQIIDLRDSLILSDQTILADGLYISEHVRHMSGGWLTSGEGYDFRHLRNLSPADRLAILRLPSGIINLPDSSVYFLFHTVIGSASFGHFLHDTMIQLIAFDHLKATYNNDLVPIIVNDLHDRLRYPGMAWIYEGLIGPLKDAVHVQADAVGAVRRAFTTNRLMHVGDGGISFQAVGYLRERIFDHFKPSEDRIRRKRVYVSRRDVNNREANNMQDVEALLQAHDFSEVVIQGMTPQAVFDALYDAEVVVGMHGSGLMNYVYTREPALVVELAHEGYLWDSILSFAAACGHTPARVMYEDGKVRIDDLRTVLEAL